MSGCTDLHAPHQDSHRSFSYFLGSHKFAYLSQKQSPKYLTEPRQYGILVPLKSSLDQYNNKSNLNSFLKNLLLGVNCFHCFFLHLGIDFVVQCQ